MEGIYDRPLYALTVEEFTKLLDERIQAAVNTTKESSVKTPVTGRLVYGLKGICELFNVSHLTAQRYKDGIIKEAVKQCGRKIVVDADLALKLFNERRSER